MVNLSTCGPWARTRDHKENIPKMNPTNKTPQFMSLDVNVVRYCTEVSGNDLSWVAHIKIQKE